MKELPLLPLRLWVMRYVADTHSVHAGITLKDQNNGEVEKASLETYFQIIRDALDLLCSCDTRRFRLVQREIRYIVLRYLPDGGASYAYPLQECRIHFHGLLPRPPAPEEPFYQWWVAWTASTLVHEATHGRLFRSGIPYRVGQQENWERVEKVCNRQQRYFAERIPDTTYYYARDLVKPLDVEWYRNHFGASRRERLRAYLTYLRENRRQR